MIRLREVDVSVLYNSGKQQYVLLKKLKNLKYELSAGISNILS